METLSFSHHPAFRPHHYLPKLKAVLLKPSISPITMAVNVDVNWTVNNEWTLSAETAFDNVGIAAYRLDNTGEFYIFRINILTRYNDGEYTFTDASGDTYSLSINESGTHYVDYNSSNATITNVNYSPWIPECGSACGSCYLIFSGLCCNFTTWISDYIPLHMSHDESCFRSYVGSWSLVLISCHFPEHPIVCRPCAWALVYWSTTRYFVCSLLRIEVFNLFSCPDRFVFVW